MRNKDQRRGPAALHIELDPPQCLDRRIQRHPVFGPDDHPPIGDGEDGRRGARGDL